MFNLGHEKEWNVKWLERGVGFLLQKCISQFEASTLHGGRFIVNIPVSGFTFNIIYVGLPTTKVSKYNKHNLCCNGRLIIDDCLTIKASKNCDEILLLI